MIIKKFEEQVERFSKKLAVKTGNQTLTYAELNFCANGVAHEILRGDQAPAKNSNNSIVSLLFEHGADMIVGIIGALKANKTYVPLDVTYPQNRLLEILDHSESYIILTNHKNLPLAETLTTLSDKKIKILTIDNIPPIPGEIPGNHIKREAAGNRPAYILYTSGSTGRPKGVVQSQQNVLYFIDHWTRRFSITGAHRMTLLASLSHDAAVPDIFAALLNGAALYPYDIKEKPGINELIDWLHNEQITIWHSVPTFYRYFIRGLSGNEIFPHLQLIVLGGEEVRAHDVMMFKTYFPSAKFANIYGQSESTVNSIWLYSPRDPFKKVLIGEPIGDTEILLVDESGGTVEEVGTGEIVIASDHVALEYWKDKENSETVFTHDSELGRLYWTGDWGRLTADGDIVFIGRKDLQVKIRGFRVETTEIETRLLNHPAIKEAVVVAKEDENAENYLCAYIVPGEPLAAADLREFLSAELPGYMIPQYFINMEKMPLTATGKIDRQALPEPGPDIFQPVEYEAPANEIEKEITRMWQETLGKEKIGINANFFDLGGHSLLIITLISKIHQTLQVKLELKDVFDYPTIKTLSQLIMKSKQTIFSSIEPVEEKEYYEATADQMRLFVVNEFEGISTTYNLTAVMKLEGVPDGDHLQEIFQELIKRHESLRTSFELRDQKLVQHIHDHKDVDFHIMYIDAEKENRQSEEDQKKIVKDFIRPFDLNAAPLIRVGQVKLAAGTHLLLLDIHHIIADGASGTIILNEFVRLYNGEKLPELKLKYKDYSEWQNHMVRSGQVKQQEEYWLERFKGEIPVLNLTFNYPRPEASSFEGDMIRFTLGKKISQRLNQLAKDTGTTLYMVLLAIYNVLLHKYTDQEDIVVGSFIAGRNQVDLEHIVGYFAKTLALRNYPAANKTFLAFLREIKDNTLKAFENQLYPFSQLVEKLDIKKGPGRNPLFDTAFVLPNPGMAFPGKSRVDIPLKATPLPYENRTAMFDLSFEAFEIPEGIVCCIQYCTKLFKRETIELMKERLLILIESILNNTRAEIRTLDWKILIEKEMTEVREVEFDF